MSEFQYVLGTFGGIEEKPAGGWKTVKVMRAGKEYPLKMDTKKDDLLDQARAIPAGEIATWKFSESDSGTPNPNRPGSNFINRRFEAVKLGSHIPEEYGGYEPLATGNGGSSSSDGGGATAGGKSDVPPEVWEAKERRDFRSRSWAHTLSAMAHTIKVEETPGEIFTRLHPLQRLIYLDIVQDLDTIEGKDQPDEIPF